MNDVPYPQDRGGAVPPEKNVKSDVGKARRRKDRAVIHGSSASSTGGANRASMTAEQRGDNALFWLSKKENGYVNQPTYCIGVVIERRLDGGM
jgi:hypothetical protein